MEELNKLELSILERLSINYPSIKGHIPFLRVESRENTGVGMYINFSYINPVKKLLDVGIENTSRCTKEIIEMGGLKYGLGHQVDITDGKIKFIEIFTYGEEWDGDVLENFIFTK